MILARCQGVAVTMARRAVPCCVVKLWAFVDALMRRTDAFVAAGKLTKPAWLLILGLTVAAAVLFPTPLGLLSIVGTVAAFVYLLDARPAWSQVTRRRCR